MISVHSSQPPVDGAPPRESAAGAPSDLRRPIVSSADLERLARAIASPGLGPATTEYLRWVLDNARVLAPRDIPDSVVTMQSRVRVRSAHTPEPERLVLCYPGDEESVAEGLSVLSPLGASLLGAEEGSSVRVLGPRPRVFVVEALEYQPERAGVYDS